MPHVTCPEALDRGPTWLREHSARLVDYVRAITPRAGMGMSQTDHPYCTVLHAIGENYTLEEGETHPWQCMFRRDSGDLKLKLRPGSVNSITCTNMLYEETIADDETIYVVLTAATNGYTVTSCSWSTESSPPSPNSHGTNTAPSAFTDLLAVVVNGVAFAVRTDNLSASVEVITSNDDNTYYTWLVS